jgi:hypothetical protein
MRRTSYLLGIVAAMGVGAASAAAQAPAAAPATGSKAPPAAAATASPAAKNAPARACTRLPLSDIQVGREATIASARKKLIEEYAPAHTKGLGWKSFTVSNETASCEDYLYLPLIGQEYRCLVTATFCRKS